MGYVLKEFSLSNKLGVTKVIVWEVLIEKYFERCYVANFEKRKYLFQEKRNPRVERHLST